MKSVCTFTLKTFVHTRTDILQSTRPQRFIVIRQLVWNYIMFLNSHVCVCNDYLSFPELTEKWHFHTHKNVWCCCFSLFLSPQWNHYSHCFTLIPLQKACWRRLPLLCGIFSGPLLLACSAFYYVCTGACVETMTVQKSCVSYFTRNVYSLALHTTEIVNAIFNLNKILLAFQSVC